MTVRVYKYTDPGAPFLASGLGMMVNVMDRCLVDGYGPRSALIGSGTRATFTAGTSSTNWGFIGWIKPDAAAIASSQLFFVFDSVNSTGIGMANGKLMAFSAATVRPFNTTLVADTVYMVAFNSTGGLVNAWVNGVLDTTTVSATIAMAANNVFNNSAGTAGYTGYAAEWNLRNNGGIPSTTIGATSTVTNTIASIYSAGTTFAATNFPVLVDAITPYSTNHALWRLDEKSGATTLADSLNRSTFSASVVSGTITFEQPALLSNTSTKTAAGWTKEFSATNKAVYRQAALGLNLQAYLDFDHSSVVGQPVVRGYETMTAVNTGTNPFPTTAQALTLKWDGSTNSARPTPWYMFADNRRILWWSASTSITNDGSGSTASFFGDIKPVNSADIYRTLIIGTTSSNGNNTDFTSVSSIASTSSNNFMVRNEQGTVGSVTASKNGSSYFMNNTGTMGSTGIRSSTTGPNLADGAFYTSKVYVGDSTNGGQYRGTLPGVWAPLFIKTNLQHGYEFVGTGGLTGKTLMWMQNGSSGGGFLVETSDTWDI